MEIIRISCSFEVVQTALLGLGFQPVRLTEGVAEAELGTTGPASHIFLWKDRNCLHLDSIPLRSIAKPLQLTYNLHKLMMEGTGKERKPRKASLGKEGKGKGKERTNRGKPNPTG